MKEKITQQHINLISEAFIDGNLSDLTKVQIDNLLKEISKYIEYDNMQAINNNFLPKDLLYIFNLINDYYSAYKLSEKNMKKDRVNTLESLGKGNEKRKKRYLDNKATLKDKKSSSENKIIAYFENIFLRLIIKGKFKIAYLLLGTIFIYKEHFKHYDSFFKYSKPLQKISEKLVRVLNFYSFTYLSPTKIVNSIAILLYLYFKEAVKLEEEKALQIVRYIINTYFKDHAPSDNRKSYLIGKEFYCAGIYNDLPIFQQSTSTQHSSYYSKKDIRRMQKYIKYLKKDSEGFYEAVLKSLSKDMEEKKKTKLANIDEKLIKELIDSLPKSYLMVQQFKLIQKLQIKPKKTIKYYQAYLKTLIITLFVGIITKFALRKKTK